MTCPSRGFCYTIRADTSKNIVSSTTKGHDPKIYDYIWLNPIEPPSP